MQGGTITITNPGIYGPQFGTPIILQPQVAILGMGGIFKEPTVITDKDVDRYFCDVLEINPSQLDHVQPDGKPVVSTKSKNMLAALQSAYQSAPGSEAGHGTVWGALNAVTYYATFQKTVRDTSGTGTYTARFASNIEGDSSAMKARAFLLAAALVA